MSKTLALGCPTTASFESNSFLNASDRGMIPLMRATCAWRLFIIGISVDGSYTKSPFSDSGCGSKADSCKGSTSFKSAMP